jgi:hypothetical protein
MSDKYEALEKLALLLQKKALYGAVPVKATQTALSQAMGRAAMMGAVGLGAAGLAELASSPIGTVPNTLAKGRAFQQMLDGSQRVQMLHAADPHRVKGMFDVVYQYFPAGAAQTHTAAGLVENLSQYDSVDHKTIQDLIKMQKDYAETHRGQRRDDPGFMTRSLNVLERALF